MKGFYETRMRDFYQTNRNAFDLLDVVGYYCAKNKVVYEDKIWNVAVCMRSGHTIHQHMSTKEKNHFVKRLCGKEKSVAVIEDEFASYLDGDGL